MQKKVLRCRQLFRIDGVGVDLNKFYPRTIVEKIQLRNELGYNIDDFIITNVAEINKNKNQIMLVKALPILKEQITNIRVLFIGKDNYPDVKNMVNKLNLGYLIEFLGYRNDIDKLITLSNLAFSASLREGLPINIIESMACGIPIVCSRNRGHNSLILDGVSGLLFSVENKNEMINKIILIYKNQSLAEKLGKEAMKQSKKYSVDIALEKMSAIYKPFM
ncbi:hypothetical protein FACS1894137_19810 [Spirochaetia bacterium]|nr:hypothetical protein FACS1894137_19810 [Spirochaetia bacterium]